MSIGINPASPLAVCSMACPRRHAAAGVEVLAYRCEITPERVAIADRIPWNGAG